MPDGLGEAARPGPLPRRRRVAGAVAAVAALLAALLVVAVVHRGPSPHRHDGDSPAAVGRCADLGIAGPAEWDRLDAPDYARVMREVADVGAGRVRIGAIWGDIERTPGEYTWDALDMRLGAAAEAGLRPLLVLQGAPGWVEPPRAGTTPAAAEGVIAAFGDFAGALAARYGDRVRDFEIWNEQNLPRFWDHPDVDLYVALLRVAHATIHAALPGATVVSGGLSPAADTDGAIAPMTFLHRFFALGGHLHADAIGMHPYSYPEMPSGGSVWNAFRMLEDIEALMAEYGDGGKPIWLTEYGAPTAGDGGVGEERQAGMITEAVRMASHDPALGPLFVYTLVDSPVGDVHDRERYFGLVDERHTPKPAHRALRNLAATLCPVPVNGR